jgi:hypothetical protein
LKQETSSPVEPETRPCELSELIVLTSQTGDEFLETGRDVEHYILPLLREHKIRFVQIARRGHLEADGITVLDDTRSPEKVYLDGDYKLSDELLSAGTVPQFGSTHRCSMKAKAFPLELWMNNYLDSYASDTPIRHAFGYSADETKRVAKAEIGFAERNRRIVVLGYNAEETKRVNKAKQYDTPQRIGYYPLVEWG